MLIVGAGLAGLLAAVLDGGAHVVEKSSSLPNNHHAVLRFKTDNISKLTGIPFKKVKVYKSIWSDGKHVAPSIDIMNKYSIKVTNGIFDRSISNIDAVTRYIAPPNFNEALYELCKDRVEFNSEHTHSYYRQPIISTVPMPFTASNIGIDFDVQWNYEEIKVATIELQFADVYQTIYYPDYDTNIYRASITGSRLIVEYKNDAVTDSDFDMIDRSFGIYAGRNYEYHTQKFGKIVPLADEDRKRILTYLTDQHSIYSLGRFACWRNILLDDIPGDFAKIKRLINTSIYDMRIGK